MWHRRIRKHKQLVCCYRYIPCDYFRLTIRPFSRSISWLAYYFRNHCSISFGCDGIYYAFITNLPSKNAGSLSSLPILAKRPLLIGLYATTVIIVSAHFTAYTYIEPFMVQIGELDPNLATIILLVFGVSGITASVIFNRLYRFGPTQFISTAMILLAVS